MKQPGAIMSKVQISEVTLIARLNFDISLPTFSKAL